AGSPARTCATERVLAANRANAARSTGPRTRAGKAAVARNARRHGLSVPVLADPALAPEAAALAQRIAGEGASEPRRAAALRIAGRQVAILRIRRLRTQIMTKGFAAADPTARLMRLDRYERRALSRRKAAIKAFDALGGAAAPRRRRDPWAAVAAAAGLRGVWQNKPDFGAVRSAAPMRRRNPWAAVRVGGFWQNKPDLLAATRQASRRTVSSRDRMPGSALSSRPFPGARQGDASARAPTSDGFHCSAHCFFHCFPLLLRRRLFSRRRKALHCN